MDWVIASALLVGAGLGLAALLARRARRRLPPPTAVEPLGPEPCPPQPYGTDPREERFSFTRLPEPLPVHPRSPRLADQPEAWRRRMRDHGDALRSRGVAEITFVHGTFVGSDPFALLAALQRASPSIRPLVQRRLGASIKRLSDRLTKDAGNFERPWVELFGAATRLPCSLFVWSSENTHTARLSAAVRLVGHLAERFEGHRASEGGRRALLVGHSHAGQVFALALQLVHAVEHAPLLLDVAERLGEDRDWLSLHLERLRELELEVVTMGTPVRYGWPRESQARLLHIVNHRGAEPVGGRLDGVRSTRDGDYVQQWGVAGSDLPAPSPQLRQLNGILDEALGPGCAPRIWLDNLRHRRRVHHGGHTLLVDYRDDDPRGRPNFLATNFGHSVYTRRRSMEFLTAAIAGALPVPRTTPRPLLSAGTEAGR